MKTLASFVAFVDLPHVRIGHLIRMKKDSVTIAAWCMNAFVVTGAINGIGIIVPVAGQWCAIIATTPIAFVRMEPSTYSWMWYISSTGETIAIHSVEKPALVQRWQCCKTCSVVKPDRFQSFTSE